MPGVGVKMKVAAVWLTMLWAQVRAVTFCGVTALNPLISATTDYRFTLILGLSSPESMLDVGDIIKMQFPSEAQLTITAPTAPNCYYESIVGNTNFAVCSISSANVISFTVESKLNTATDPLVFVLGPALNPPAVMTTSSFQISVKQGTTVSTADSGIVATYAPGTLRNTGITSSTPIVYTAATITITFMPQHDIPTQGLVQITFPSDFEVGVLANLVVQGSVSGGGLVTLTGTVPGSNQVLASGLFAGAGVLASSNPTISVTVYPVTTPNSIRTSASVSVNTADSAGNQIDMIDSGLTVTPTQPRGISNAIITPSPYTVQKPATYSFTLGPDISFPSGGKLTITFPTTISIGTVLCTFIANFSGTSGSCTVSSQTVSTVNMFYTKTGTKLFVMITVAGLTNPPDTVATTNFQFATYDNFGKLMCQNLVGPQVTAITNAVTVNSAVRAGSKVGADGPYRLTFTMASKTPQNAKIKLVLPMDQMVSSPGIECYVVSSGVTLSTNVCAGLVTSTATAYVILLTEWCSSGPTGCPAGTQLVLSLSGVKNQPYVKTISSSIEVYTYNAAQTGGVDAVSTGQVFTPTLVPETITDGVISRTGNTVGQAAVFLFSFTPPISLISGAVISLNLPQLVAYPSAISLASVDNAGNNPIAQTSTTSQYGDTSYSVVSITSACSTSCVSTIKLYFKLSGVTNKPMVVTLGTSYSLTVKTSDGYSIATGVLTSSIGALQPGTITAITISRSSNSIQTPVLISLAFTHSTILASTSQIVIAFPDKLALEGTGLICKRVSDSAVLSYTRTLGGSGAIATLTVSGYCSASCPGGSGISLEFSGLTTPSTVQTISGTLGITTTDQSYTVDTGSLADITTQIGPLVPGTLINISIQQDNPTTSATSGYKFIFTSAHTIPAGALVTVAFPAQVSTASVGSCSKYIQISAGLGCTLLTNILTVSSGFPSSLTGSWMVGFSVAGIGNAATAGISGPFTISLVSSAGDVIDTGTATVSFYGPAGTCASQCATCAGTDTSCYSCTMPSSSPLQNGFSCLQTCPSSAFLLSSPAPLSCITCHFTCASCDSSLSSGCISCSLGLYRSNRSCLTACPSGTSLSGSNCVSTSPCTSPCLTCSTSPTFCLSCDSVSASPVLNAKDGTCVATQSGSTQHCPNGYYQTGLNCQSCAYSCSTCLNLPSYCTGCQTIYGIPLLNMVDNTCVSVCPVGVTVLIGSTCEKCHTSCATCSATSSTSCLTCPSTGTKYKTSLNECVSTCPLTAYYFDNSDGTFACVASCDIANKYYIDVAAKYCRPCYATCLTCSAETSTTCLTCDITGTFKYFSKSTSECLSVCPLAQYTYTLTTPYYCYVSCPEPDYNFIDATSQKVCIAACSSTRYFVIYATNTCAPCYSACLTCTDVQQNSCTSCDPAGSTSFLTDAGYCLVSCPPNLFIYLLNSSKKCYTVCPTTDSFNYINAISSAKECISTCGPGFWVETATNYCKPCDTTCKTCSGGTNLQCSSCETGGSYKYLTYDNKCLSACPSYLYLSNFSCLQTCPNGTFKFDDPGGFGKCVSTCSGSFWIDTPNAYCRACDSSCLTCSGGTSLNCLSCDLVGSTAFFTYDGQCVNSCPLPMFIYTIGGVKKCLSSCPGGTYYFQNANTSVQCIASCNTDNKLYIDIANSYCRPCYSNCLTCQNNANTGCLSCDLGSTFLFFTEDGQCLGSCPLTQYTYTLLGQKKCYFSCSMPTYNFVDAGGNKVCASNCDIANKYFVNTATNTCSPCASSCFTCSAASSTSCLSCEAAGSFPLLTDDKQCVSSCPSNMYLYGSKCLLACPGGTYFYTDQTSLQKCVTTCDTGFYLNVATSHCYQCFSTCLTCSGIAVNNCVTCDSAGTYSWLSDTFQCLTGCGSLFTYTIGGAKKCYVNCPSPSYNYNNAGALICTATCTGAFYVDIPNNYCRPCDQTCLTCDGTTATSCLSCDSSGTYQYLTDTGMCVTQCPPAMFILAAQKKCFTTCPPGSYNYSNPLGYKECIQACGTGFWIDAGNNYCRPCYSTCKTCGGTAYQDCLSCDQAGATPYLTSTGECMVVCPTTMFTLETTKSCYSNCPPGWYNSLTTGNSKICVNTCGAGNFVEAATNYCKQCYSTCLSCDGTTYQDCVTCDVAGTTSFLTDTGECVISCASTQFQYTIGGEKRCYATCPPPSYNYDNTLGYKQCIAACGPGFFIDSTNNYCKACATTCLTCSGTAANNCLSCNISGSTPYLTDGGQCLASCPATVYQYTLLGQMNCYTICPLSSFNYDNPLGFKQCIATCGAGHYVDAPNNYCRPCWNTCLTCNGITASNCVSCSSTGTTPFLTDAGQCVPSCSSTQYQYTLNSELRCYTICPSPSYNFDNTVNGQKQCLETCGAGNYIDSPNNYCRPCDSSCKTCEGITASDCLSCNLTGLTPFLTDTKRCLAACLVTLFRYTINGEKRCYSICPASAYNYDNTLGFKECIASCVGTNFIDTLNNYCRACDSSCATCSGTANTNCLSCSTSGSTPYLTDGGQCLASCPATVYQYTLLGQMNCYTICPLPSYNYDNPLGFKQCIATCGAGLYVDAPNNYCRPCWNTCLTCNGITASNCVSCNASGSSPYLTDGAQCVASCSASGYQYTLNGEMRCYATCPLPSYNFDNSMNGQKQCISTCGAGFYIDTGANYCRACDSSCLSCDGTTASKCLSCNLSGSTPYFTDTNMCVAACPALTYKYTIGGAMRCYTNCPSGSYNWVNPSNSLLECTATCSSGYFLTGNNCQACDVSCLTCSGAAASNCISCDPSGPTSFLTETTTCLTQCPLAQFTYNLGGVKRCYAACPVPTYNYINPTSSVQECTATCTGSVYLDTGANFCRACHSTCLTCSGTDEANCVTCSSSGPTPFLTDSFRCVAMCPSTLFSYTLNSEARCYLACPLPSYNHLNPLTAAKECIAACTTSVYYDSGTNFCYPCSSLCKTCDGTGTSDCLSCDQTGGTPYFTSVGECRVQCPGNLYRYTLNGAMDCFATCLPGTYNFANSGGYLECILTCGAGFFVSLPNSCNLCFNTCQTCKDAAATDCLSCSPTGTTPFLSYTGECLSECLVTDYRYNSAGMMKCLTACPPGSYEYSNPGGFLQCVDVCGPGLYLDIANSICSRCYPTCLTCEGTTASDCLNCDSAGSYPFLSDAGSCLSTCGTLYQYIAVGASRCVVACPPGSFSYTAVGGVLQCVTTCGPGFFLDIATTPPTCYNCSPLCSTCSGTTATNCVTCNQLGTYPYLTETHTCVAQCGSLYQYSIGGSMMCYTVCPGGSYGYTSTSGLKECVTACGPGFYLDAAASTCTKCYATCLNCIGLGSSNCSSCDSAGSFPNLSETGQCVSSCGALYLFSGHCVSTCSPPTMFFDSISGKQCVNTCSSTNYFIDTPNNYCRACDSTCLTCNGIANTQCLSCSTTGSYRYFTDTGMCVAACPSTLYSYSLGGIYRCYVTCPSPGTLNYVNLSLGKECVVTCPIGTFVDVGNNACVTCYSACSSCSGSAPNNCLSCDKTGLTGFLTDTGLCVSVCPSTLYIYNPNGEKRCVTACPPGSLNFDNVIGYKECVLVCGSGNYVDSANNYCRPCYLTCKTCNGSLSTNCVSCDKAGLTPYLTEDLQCVASCPATTFLYSPNGEMKCLATCTTPYFNSATPAGSLECVGNCGAGKFVDTAVGGGIHPIDFRLFIYSCTDQEPLTQLYTLISAGHRKSLGE